MSIPRGVMEQMRDLHFSTKLCKVIKNLYEAGYAVEISVGPFIQPDAPFNAHKMVNIVVHTDGMMPYRTPELFRCIVSGEYETLAATDTSLTAKYDGLAEMIYAKYFGSEAAEKIPYTISNTSKVPLVLLNDDADFFNNLKKEIDSRGNFAIDIPKFVDVLFRLGVIIDKDDLFKEE